MARDEDKLPIDLAVELERARRLGDRFDGGEDGSGELAREQRARRLSAEFLNHVSLGSLLGRATQGIAQLEESLELQRQKQLKALAAETFVEAPPVAPTPLERNLQRTLDDVTVKNVLDFRNTTGLSAEATATSAVCAVANLDDTVQMSIHSLNPDQPWEGAMELLNKPGHFINTLRRFPQAVFAKKVSEDNIVAARHFLAMARRSGGAEEAPPAVAAVQRWIAAAIQLWEAPVQKPVATPQRVEVNCKVRDYKPLRPHGEVRPLRSDRMALNPRFIRFARFFVSMAVIIIGDDPFWWWWMRLVIVFVYVLLAVWKAYSWCRSLDLTETWSKLKKSKSFSSVMPSEESEEEAVSNRSYKIQLDGLESEIAYVSLTQVIAPFCLFTVVVSLGGNLDLGMADMGIVYGDTNAIPLMATGFTWFRGIPPGRNMRIAMFLLLACWFGYTMVAHLLRY
eukprot:s885_g3.t1